MKLPPSRTKASRTVRDSFSLEVQPKVLPPRASGKMAKSECPIVFIEVLVSYVILVVRERHDQSEFGWAQGEPVKVEVLPHSSGIGRAQDRHHLLCDRSRVRPEACCCGCHAAVFRKRCG